MTLNPKFQNKEINTKFLPNIDFQYFFEQNITVKTKIFGSAKSIK